MKHSYLITASAILSMLLVPSCSKDTPDVPEEHVYPYVSISSDNENVPGSGVVSTQYSDSPSGSDIGKLMDNDLSTAFVTPHKDFYVLWSGNKPFSLKSYTIVSPAGSEASVPESWILSGSNDNKAWVQIDKKTGQSFAGSNIRKEYRVYSSSTYKYYRFMFTSSASVSAISEIYFADGTATDIKDLMYLTDDDTHSTLTPMGRFCENRHKTTASDLAWLADPSNEPTIAFDDSSISWGEFDVDLYPHGSPVPADVNQHAIGDCCALAVFGSFAYVFPEFIKSIITDNGNRTYTVKMFDPQGERIEVTLSSKFPKDVDNNITGVTGKCDVACWSSILEKAVMKWNSIYHCNNMIDGIGIEHTAPLFLGNGDSFAIRPGAMDYEQMQRAVTVLLNKGYVLAGGFHDDKELIGNGPYRTIALHAFTFVFCSSSLAVYGMRNPWGFTDGGPNPDPDDGVIPIVDDGKTQPMIDIRVCHPGAAAEYKQRTLLPYTPPTF